VLTPLNEIPQIIFSTAYDQYALKAFEVHAVDYLLKPYTRERFHQAVQRIMESDRPHSAGPLAESLLQEKQSYPERILVQSGRRLINLAVQNIIRIEADGDYSRLITADQTYLSNYGIGKIEERLDPENFLRVHRSSIVNIQYIGSVDKYASSYDVKMQNGDVVRVSRGYMNKIKALTF
jgi:two-component system LytT family response regulator